MSMMVMMIEVDGELLLMNFAVAIAVSENGVVVFRISRSTVDPFSFPHSQSLEKPAIDAERGVKPR